MTNIVGGGWYEVQLRLATNAQQSLEQALREIGASTGGTFGEQFTDAAAAGLTGLSEAVTRAVSSITPPDLTVTPTVDAGELSAEVDAAASAADADVLVDLDVDAGQLAAEVGAAADAADTTVDVAVDVDSDQIATTVDAAVGAVDGRTVHVDVEADAEQISPEIDAAVGAASGRTVQVGVDLDAEGVSAQAATSARQIVTSVGAAAIQAGSALRAEIGSGISEGGVSGAATLARSIAAVGVGFGASQILGDLTEVDRKIRETATLFGTPASQSGGLIDSLTGEVKTLAGELGVLQTDIVPTLYDSVSAGVAESDLPVFLENVGKFALAGAADLSVAGDAVTTALNAWGRSAGETEAITDSLFAAVQGGKTTVDQLGSSLFQVAPAAASLNVPLEEVNAALATLTAQGVPTSVAATRLTAQFTAMLSKTKELTPVFNDLGFATAEAAIKQEGLQFAVNAVNAAAGGSATELQKLLGSTEAVQAVQILAGTGAEKFSSELERQANAAGVVSNAFEILDDGPAATMRRLQETAQSLGLSVAETLAPALDAALPLFGSLEGIIGAAQPVVGLLADGVGVLADAFGLLPGPMQSVVVGAVGVNAVLGKFDVFGKAASGLLSLASTASSAGPQLAGVSSGLLSAGSAVEGFGAKAAGAGGGLRGLVSAAGGLGTLGPIALGAGAAIGAIAIAWQQGKQRAAEFEAEVDELTAAIIDQNGALKEGADGWNEYILNQSRFESRNQIDDLAELGITTSQVADAMSGNEEAMRQFALAAADAGDAGSSAGINISDGMREMLETTDDVPGALQKIWEASVKGGGDARGNIDLLVSLLEAVGVTAETTAQQLDRIKVEGADKYGQDTIDRLQELEDAGKDSTEILQILGDEGRLSADKIKEIGDAVPAVEELVGSAENAQAALDKLQVTRDILPPGTQARLEGLVAAGTDATDVLAILTREGLLADEVLTNIGVEGLARIAPEADAAVSVLDRLRATAESLPAKFADLQTFDFGNFATFSIAGLDEKALDELSTVRGEMEAFAAENSIPIEVVAQFGEESLTRIKEVSTSAADDIAGIFRGSFSLDFGDDVIPSLEEGLDAMEKVVEERANFAENIIELQRRGLGQLVGVIREASPEVAAAWAQQAVDSSDAQLAGFADQVAGFSNTIGGLQTEAISVAGQQSGQAWYGLGLTGAEQFRTGIATMAGATDQVIAPELAALGLQAANMGSTVGPGFVQGIDGIGNVIQTQAGLAWGPALTGGANDAFADLAAQIPTLSAPAVDMISKFGAKASAAVPPAFSAFGAQLQSTFDSSFSAIPSMIAGQAPAIGGAFDLMAVDVLGGWQNTMSPAAFGMPIQTALAQVAPAITGQQGVIASALAAVGVGSADAFSSPLRAGLDTAASTAMASAQATIQATVPAVVGAAQQAGATTSTAFAAPLQSGLPLQTQAAMANAQATIVGSVPGLTSASTQAGQAVPIGYAPGLAAMNPATQGAFDTVSGIINASTGILGSAAGLAGLGVGQRYGSGIAAGMESQRGVIERKAAEMVAIASAATKTAAKIASPSKVFFEHGSDMGQGAVLGLASQFGAAQTAGTELVDALDPNWDTATASAEQAAETITSTFSDVTLIPESEVDRTLSLLGTIQEEVGKITLEDIQSPEKGNVFTSFASKAFDAVINDSVNSVFNQAAKNAVVVTDAASGGAYRAGSGSTVASQGFSPAAISEMARQIAGAVGRPPAPTVNVQAPVQPIMDWADPRASGRAGDIVGRQVSHVLERSNIGE